MGAAISTLSAFPQWTGCRRSAPSGLPQDVSGRVHVRIGAVAAGQAAEIFLAQPVTWLRMAAKAAALAGMGRIHRHHQSPQLRGLGFEHDAQLA